LAVKQQNNNPKEHLPLISRQPGNAGISQGQGLIKPAHNGGKEKKQQVNPALCLTAES
jgi:hypothetical protein